MKIDSGFIDNFNACMQFYECNREEIAYEKMRVMQNFDAAARTYSIIAAGIRGFDDD